MEIFRLSTNFARANNRISMEVVKVVKTGKSGQLSALDAPPANAQHDGGNRSQPGPIRGTRIEAPGSRPLARSVSFLLIDPPARRRSGVAVLSRGMRKEQGLSPRHPHLFLQRLARRGCPGTRACPRAAHSADPWAGQDEFRLHRTPHRLFFVAPTTFPGQPCAFAGMTTKSGTAFESNGANHDP
jgi:hypothetical protein